MSYLDLKRAKELRDNFKNFGRAGISERVLVLARELLENPSYINAIITCGKMTALFKMAKEDGYWSEKSSTGFYDEYYYLTEYKAIVEKDEEGNTVNVKFEKRLKKED